MATRYDKYDNVFIRDVKTDRNRAIVKAWRAGESEPAIGARHGISARRVAQIVAQAAMAEWRHNRRARQRRKTRDREFERDYWVKQRRYNREIAKLFADHPEWTAAREQETT